MPRVPTSARVVIIGGGISGCSVAYHLSALGWTDVVLLERRQLTCGTTWHAAGLVGQLRASQNLTRLAKYSADLYTRLEAETGLATGFRQTGSITVALTEARREEILRQASLARAFDVDGGRAFAGARSAALYPHLNLEGVVAGVHLPGDGQADPANIALALAKGARAARRAHRRGGEGHRRHPRGRPRHRRRLGSRRRARPHRRRARRELRRHVGPRSRGRGGRDPAAPRLRALLHRHRGDPRPRPAAGAAGSRRMRLLQGGRRQAAARRLRAGGEALGHGGHPRGLLLRPAARGLRPFRADPRDGASTGCRCWPRPASTPSSTARRASRPTTATISARRRSSAATGWRRATTRSASPRPAARAWRWRSGWRTARRPSTSGRSTSAAPSRSSATGATCASG